MCRADRAQSNGSTLRSLASFHIELEQFCCYVKNHVMFLRTPLSHDRCYQNIVVVAMPGEGLWRPA